MEIKNKTINFFILNKIKIYFIGIILFLGIFSIVYVKNSILKKNNLIAEKYIQANLYLTTNKKDEAKVLFEEIILSKNKFYSILALNTIIEKDLISNKNKILEYFITLEKTISKNEQEDLIILKKALYLIKVLDEKKGIELLNKLVEKNSTLKTIAEDILK